MAIIGDEAATTSDETAIEALVRAFFSAFTSGPDAAARLEDLRTDDGWRISSAAWDDERQG